MEFDRSLTHLQVLIFRVCLTYFITRYLMYRQREILYFAVTSTEQKPRSNTVRRVRIVAIALFTFVIVRLPSCSTSANTERFFWNLIIETFKKKLSRNSIFSKNVAKNIGRCTRRPKYILFTAVRNSLQCDSSTTENNSCISTATVDNLLLLTAT